MLTDKGFFLHDHKNFFRQIVPPDSATIGARKLEDANENNAKPFRFAEKINVNIDFKEEANWIIDGNYAFGRLTLIVARAKSLGVFFDSFKLPLNSEMYIYNNRGSMITSAITDAENNKNNTWGSVPFKGDTLNIELKVPIELKDSLKLNISTISYGYKDIYSVFCCGLGTSASCNINVLCPLGNSWVNQTQGVALVIGDQGTDYFTGEMVMNTCGTNIPYFLTAWHALDGYVSTWQFVFRYWSPTCSPTQAPTNALQFNGASLLASNMASDFALIQLFQTPSSSSNITYLGWNRGTAAATNTVGIHQPEGDVMKICSDANAPLLAGFNAAPFNTNSLNWWKAHFQQGTVEPGSSGSALFDQNQRIVGQLSGNPGTMGNYCAEQIGEYGRFDLSWAGGGTNSTRLSNWLDPLNTGAITTNTTNVSALTVISGFSISGNSYVCTSQPYSVNTSSPVTWTASPAGILNFSCTSCNSTTVTKVGNGSATLTATINSGCGTGFSANLSISIGGPYVGINYSPWGSCNGSVQDWQVLSANFLLALDQIGTGQLEVWELIVVFILPHHTLLPLLQMLPEEEP